MRTGLWGLAGAVACAVVLAGSGAVRGEEEEKPADLLRLVSLSRGEDGVRLELEIGEDELGRLGLQALEKYLREERPSLFGDVTLPLVRYRSGRLAARDVSVSARPKEPNILDVAATADVVAERQVGEVRCSVDGWKPRCRTVWEGGGTATVATLQAWGSLHLAARAGAALGERPVDASVYVRRVRGTLTLSAFGAVSLAFDLDPPRLVDQIELGLPASVARSRPELAGLVLRALRVTSTARGRIRVAATVSLGAD